MKIVSFDVDGTLVEHGFVDLVWNEGIPRLYAEREGISFEEAQELVRKKYDEIGEEDLRWYLPDYWFRELGLDGSPIDLIRQYQSEVRVFPETLEVLENLSQRFELIATSNASREFLDVSLVGLSDYLDYTFSSTTDFGLVRKDPRFYREICDILDVRPEEIAHVGDHIKFDYQVPRELGINAFFLDRGRKNLGPEDRHVVRDLKEFEAKIEALLS
jgi:putative hydrolase of the HAD superfamily